MPTFFPYLARGIVKNRAVGLAAERQYQVIETLKGSQVTRTGRGSDFEVKGLFAATPRLVEVKTGKAVLSPLQRATRAEVVRPDPFANAALAAVLGVAGGVAGAEAVKRLLKDYIQLTCDACGSEASLDCHFCPNCSAALPRKAEFWISVGLVAAGVVILILSLLTLALNLLAILLAGALLGAGIDLLLNRLRAYLSQSSSAAGIA